MDKLTFEQYCSEPAFPTAYDYRYNTDAVINHGISRLEYFVAQMAPALLVQIRIENQGALLSNSPGKVVEHEQLCSIICGAAILILKDIYSGKI